MAKGVIVTWKSHGEWRILDTFPNTSPLSHPCMNHVPFLRTFHYSSPTGSNEARPSLMRILLTPLPLWFWRNKASDPLQTAFPTTAMEAAISPLSSIMPLEEKASSNRCSP
ncbi:uncharacterized protein AAEQ78_000676 isoform 1-T2 [Lycaon pictus]